MGGLGALVMLVIGWGEHSGWLKPASALAGPFSRWGFVAGYVTNFAIVHFWALRSLRLVSKEAEEDRQRQDPMEKRLATSEERLQLALAHTDSTL